MLKETVILTSSAQETLENVHLTCTSRTENLVLTVMGNKAFVLTETVLPEPNNVRYRKQQKLKIQANIYHSFRKLFKDYQ